MMYHVRYFIWMVFSTQFITQGIRERTYNPSYCSESGYRHRSLTGTIESGYRQRALSGSTDRNLSMERSSLDIHFPNFVTTLTEIILHSKPLDTVSYFEIGAGEGVELLQLKSLFPCVSMEGINAEWHCDTEGGANCNSSADALIDVARRHGIRGIKNHYNIPLVHVGDVLKGGLDFLGSESINFLTSMNMFHYIRGPGNKVKVLETILSKMKRTSVVYMYWNWLHATVHKMDFFRISSGVGIIKGIHGRYGDSPFRGCVFFDRHSPGVHLWLARGDEWLNDPRSGRFMNIPEIYFNQSIPMFEVREFEKLIHSKSSKNPGSDMSDIVTWLDQFM